MYLILVIFGWLYVALMMAVAEATATQGTLAGAVFTFFAFGVAPVSLIAYFMFRGARRKARERAAGQASNAPDSRGEPAAHAVAPVRKEP